MFCRQIAAHPVKQPRQTTHFFLGDRPRDVLRLITITMRWNDETLGNHVRDLGTVVAPNQMHEHVESCGRSCGCHYTALIHIERILRDLQLWMTLLQSFRITPMRRDCLAIENAGGREHEHA